MTGRAVVLSVRRVARRLAVVVRRMVAGFAVRSYRIVMACWGYYFCKSTVKALLEFGIVIMAEVRFFINENKGKVVNDNEGT